jgi:hypothetical protein
MHQTCFAFYTELQMMKSLHRTAALCTAFLALAASASDLPIDQEAFRVLVARQVAIGTTMKDAEDRLIALGLQCKSVTGGWTNNVSDKTEFLFCDHQSGAPVQRRWRVAVRPLSGKVAEVRPTVGLVGP